MIYSTRGTRSPGHTIISDLVAIMHGGCRHDLNTNQNNHGNRQSIQQWRNIE